jgi:RES domain-containing protein
VPTAWRITTSPDPTRAFSGDGARAYGGRWNSKGTRVVYTADYPAAAILEQLVQISSVATLPTYFLFRIGFPESLVSVVDPTTVPDTWREPARHAAVQAIGDAWATARTSLALQVPSAVAPHHLNYLLNPVHPDFPTLTIAAPERFALDPRLPPRSRSSP